MKTYRLKKSLQTFWHIFRLYKKKRKHLSEMERKKIVTTLNHLQEEILKQDKKRASNFAKRAEEYASSHLKKSLFGKSRDFILSLLFALIVATLVRTLWFELYEIPSGSMRPTFQENDRLVVSKTSFGLNIPLYKGHFLFEPDLVKRSNTIIFTGRDMDIPDLDTMYFYLFPGKKQFVKRLIGKPGDTLYFYGGEIYGIDKNGQDISDELQVESLSKIDHVPYIYFNGRVNLPSKPTGNIYSPATISQMNQKVAKTSINFQNKLEGTLLIPGIDDYYDLWGFKNYGMARILTKSEVISFTDTKIGELEDTPLYLEIFHHPSVKYPTIQHNRDGRLFPGVGLSQTVLSLSEENLKTLFSNMYTARFIVKDGQAYRLGSSDGKYSVPLKGVPNGTYEFYYGKGYQVRTGGVRTELAKNHPLYTFSPLRVQLLYNLGIEWMTPFSPRAKMQMLLPSRYVYFRDGDLVALGASLFKKDDPALVKFTERESLKSQIAPSYRPYQPFSDSPPPFDSSGKIDKAFIKQYGITVPEKEYLVLGDNYAMSSDSREFGFVPEANLRGSPSFIFWPPGSRFGPPLQPGYPLLNTPCLIVYFLVGIILVVYNIYHRRKHKLPIKIDEHNS